MPRRRRSTSAFTLIELILVLVVIAIILAIAAPSLRGWGQGRKLENAADEFLAATRWAQSQAVADAQPLVIEIDPTANTYLVDVLDGDAKTPAAGEFGQKATLPTGFTISMTGGDSAGNLIVFQPDNRCTPATVKFTSALGEVVEVAAVSPAEPFAKVVAK